MSRQPNSINEQVCNYFKELVKKKSGLPCDSFSDIHLLQFQIKKVTGEYLSVQTLNRLFGLIKCEFNPSAATLDIIAQYLNYDSFNELVRGYHLPEKNVHLKGQTIDILTTLFKGIIPVHGNEICLCKLCLNVYKSIDKNENTGNEMYSILAGTALGRKYIFENAVYVDKLNGHYGNGIEFYLLHSKKQEEFLFAHCVLCLRSFLNNDHTQFEFHFNKISHFTLEEINTISPVILARFAAALIFNEMIQLSGCPVNAKAAAVIKLITEKNDHNFETGLGRTILAEALLLVGAYAEVLQILFNPKTNYFTGFSQTEETVLSKQNDLLKLIAGIGSGSTCLFNIRERLKAINNTKFHFLSNDFYTILLNQLIVLAGNSKDLKIAKNMLRQLIAKTGFTFFDVPVQELEFT